MLASMMNDARQILADAAKCNKPSAPVIMRAGPFARKRQRPKEMFASSAERVQRPPQLSRYKSPGRAPALAYLRLSPSQRARLAAKSSLARGREQTSSGIM